MSLLAMSEGELQELARIIRHAVAEELDGRDRIDAETHRVHHDWVREQIECARRRREIVLRAAQQAGQWAIVAALGFVGWAVWEAIVRKILG